MKSISLLLGVLGLPIIVFADPIDIAPAPAQSVIEQILKDAATPKSEPTPLKSPFQYALEVARLSDARDETRNGILLSHGIHLFSKKQFVRGLELTQVFRLRHSLELGMIFARAAQELALHDDPNRAVECVREAETCLVNVSPPARPRLAIEVALAHKALGNVEDYERHAQSLPLEKGRTELMWIARQSLLQARMGELPTWIDREEYEKPSADPDWLPMALSGVEVAAIEFEKSNSENGFEPLRTKISESLDLTPLARRVDLTIPLRALEVLRQHGEKEFHGQLLTETIPFVLAKLPSLNQKADWTVALVHELHQAGRSVEIQKVVETIAKQADSRFSTIDLQIHMTLLAANACAFGIEAEATKESDEQFVRALKGTKSDKVRKLVLLKLLLLLDQYDIDVSESKLQQWFALATH